jgi:hypothetical protein
MSNRTAETYPRVRRSKIVIASILGGATVLAGCSAHEAVVSSPKQSQRANKPKPKTAPISTTTTTQAPYDALQYESSAARESTVATALQNFGAVVLAEAVKKDSFWGPFDAYCSTPNSTTIGGWVSQGYKPQPGQTCVVQHNPQYGGGKFQIDATTVVGPNGEYTGQIIAATINTNCSVMVDYYDKVAQLDVQDHGQIISADTATTLVQAESIDAEGLACLNQTRP